MNYVTVKQYPNIVFAEDALGLLSNTMFSKRVRLGVLGTLDRLNRYGVDSLMLGSRLKKSSSGEAGILRINYDDVNVELSIEKNSQSQIVIAKRPDRRTRRRLGILGF